MWLGKTNVPVRYEHSILEGLGRSSPYGSSLPGAGAVQHIKF
jgi:hypothetical protein